MNGGISIHTYFVEASLKGKLELKIAQVPDISEKSLEMELICNGLTSMQNKLKKLLLNNKTSTDSHEDAPLELTPETALETIRLVRDAAVKRAGCQQQPEVSQALEKYIAEDYAVGSENKVIFYPRVADDSNDVMPDAIREVSKELYGDTAPDDSHQRYIRRLLTQKARKQKNTRQDLIRAGYRLGMSLQEMNLFLTKAAFTYALDLTDPWELAAAYLIVHSPATPTDAPMVFDRKLLELQMNEKKCLEAGKVNSPLVCFLETAMDKALDDWKAEWAAARDQGRGNQFLMDWAWNLYVYPDPEPARRTSFTTQRKQKETGSLLSCIYSQLEELVHAPKKARESILFSGPAESYTRNLESSLLDRRFRMLQQLYADAADESGKSKEIRFPIHNRKGSLIGYYRPSFRKDGFHGLDRNLLKVEDRDRQLSRSDIISLGIELDLGWEQIDRHLKAAGFYKLYVKDIHEKALVMSYSHGDHLDEFASLKEQILLNLKDLYAPLSEELRKKLEETEPEWVRRLNNSPEENLSE